MKQDWDISYIKLPKYDSNIKRWVVYGILPKRLPNGKRERLRNQFKSQDAATAFMKAERDKWHVFHLQGNVRNVKISVQDELEAITALGIVRRVFPDDPPTLSEMADYYVSHFSKPMSLITINEAVKQFHKWDGLTDNSKDHVAQFRRRTTKFAEAYDGMKLKDFDKSTIQGWKDSMVENEKGKVEIQNELRCLNRFFNFCIEEEWIMVNPVSKVRKPKSKRNRIEIYSNAQIMKLLECASEVAGGELVPYFALGAFCGIRPHELTRLDWADVNLNTKKCLVDGKTGEDRSVTIPDNCVEWLEPHKQASGLVAGDKNLRKRLNLIYALAGFRRQPHDIGSGRDGGFIQAEYADRLGDVDSESRPEIIQDGLRKTAITRMAQKQEKNLFWVADWAGSSPKIIKKHYLAVRGITDEQMEEFYDIKPE